MNPLSIIYWTRFLLGVAAAALSALLTGFAPGFDLLNGISVALLVYIVSYYVYKAMFVTKVEKPSKIFTTGVGAYFLSWIVAFALFTTITGPTAITITTPAQNAIFSIGDTVTIEARIANPFGSSFSGANINATNPADLPIYMVETSLGSGSYTATYSITASDPAGQWNIEVTALILGRYLKASVSVTIQTAS